ncbi:hypothetical protein BC628DRAFT_1056858 [Trametes gibbosa]|nr:hypothetical protein BC628DRAFT_1056858 [Trametes gibbosa]
MMILMCVLSRICCVLFRVYGHYFCTILTIGLLHDHRTRRCLDSLASQVRSPGPASIEVIVLRVTQARGFGTWHINNVKAETLTMADLDFCCGRCTVLTSLNSIHRRPILSSP